MNPTCSLLFWQPLTLHAVSNLRAYHLFLTKPSQFYNPIELCPRGVKTSGKDGNKTIVTALYSAAVNKAADDKAEEGKAEKEAAEAEVDVMDAADDGVLLEALSQWAPQDDSAPAEAVKKIR